VPPRIALAAPAAGEAGLIQAEAYLAWLRRAGAQPTMAAHRADLRSAAGLLLVGGDDVDPALYGEPNRAARGVDRDRDERELALVGEARRLRLPILGVCRGAQVLAVALGGTLVQDIPRELAGAAIDHHNGEPAGDLEHEIRLEPGSRLAAILGATARVNSRHHQAVDRLPAPARVAARSADGLAEAIELTDPGFVLGVQWHPERWPQPSSQDLLRAFLAAAG
jgi:putative glutamine amidotransferase